MSPDPCLLYTRLRSRSGSLCVQFINKLIEAVVVTISNSRFAEMSDSTVLSTKYVDFTDVIIHESRGEEKTIQLPRTLSVCVLRLGNFLT